MNNTLPLPPLLELLFRPHLLSLPPMFHQLMKVIMRKLRLKVQQSQPVPLHLRQLVAL